VGHVLLREALQLAHHAHLLAHLLVHAEVLFRTKDTAGRTIWACLAIPTLRVLQWILLRMNRQTRITYSLIVSVMFRTQ
jgi:hypothetical protein